MEAIDFVNDYDELWKLDHIFYINKDKMKN